MAPQPVSGRYRGARAGLEVELRIDLDGRRTMRRVSGDYFRVSGGARDYLRSMRLEEPKIVMSQMLVTVTGTALFSDGLARRKINVTIPRVESGQAPATLRHLNSSGRRTLVCVCEFESEHVRRVELEEACERGVDRPPPYDTASLPSRGPARTLSPVEAYAEAGIELAPSGEPKIIDTSDAGPDAAWSDAELHAAMEQHFSLLGDDPRWAIWLLHAVDHTDPQLAGLMFDRRGPQRQGCAVFYGRQPATTDVLRRARLYTCVHELGHGFNLLHCWQKSLATPPIESRPTAASWMNYPERDKDGPHAFFERFAFEFDDPEIIHLRHAFRQNVIMGGKPFTGGAARVRGGGWAADRKDPALRLKLTAPRALALNFPVTCGLELSTTARRGRLVPKTLGPRSGTVDIAIRRPNGDESLFEPLLRHCRGPEFSMLSPGSTPVRDFPFIHYGKQGFAFDEPGIYRLQARYMGPDGLIALSNFVTIRVLAPVSRDERRVAELIAGDEEVGTLISLMGSRAPDLSDGDAKLQRIIERHPAHPLAAVARLVRGTSLARGFKTIDAAGNVQTRPAKPDEAFSLLRPVVDLPAVARAASGAEGEAAQRQAFASALSRIGTRPGISPSVDAFVNSRRKEIAIARRGLVPSAAPIRKLPARRDPGHRIVIASEPTRAPSDRPKAS